MSLKSPYHSRLDYAESYDNIQFMKYFTFHPLRIRTQDLKPGESLNTPAQPPRLQLSLVQYAM